jgi:hypothetical protein
MVTVTAKATFLDSWYYGPPQADYVITITRVPRQGYNVGGTSQSTAPLLTSLPVGVKAAVHPWEPRQYWKVQLPPGGTLKVTGRVKAPTTYGPGALLYVKVFNSAGSASVIKSMGVSGGVGWIPFETSVFTNNTGQTADFWVAAEAVVRVIEVEMTLIQNDVLPQLSLFLDQDGDFNVDAPPASNGNDAAAYIPGALSTGLSVPISTIEGAGHQVQVIAAFVDASGQIVVPGAGDVTFGLINVSAFIGIAMNYGADTGPDFASVGGPAVAFGSDNTARITLLSKDYGGFATVTAQRGTSSATPLRVPRDDDSNKIPDSGWKLFANLTLYGMVEDAHTPYFASDDQDTDPTGNGVVGDGLVNFEEYRGFIVRGEHRRTNPYGKDLFIDSTLTTDIGYAVNLPLTKHWVAPEELSANQDPLSPLTYLVNANYTNGLYGGDVVAHSPQRGIRVRMAAYSNPDLFGSTPPGCAPVCTPNYQPTSGQPVAPAEIYVGAIRINTPTHYNSQDEDEPKDSSAIKKTTAHEIGHMILIDHYTYNGDRLTVMVSGFTWANPDWTNIPSVYDTTDTNQIQVR